MKFSSFGLIAALLLVPGAVTQANSGYMALATLQEQARGARESFLQGQQQTLGSNEEKDGTSPLGDRVAELRLRATLATYDRATERSRAYLSYLEGILTRLDLKLAEEAASGTDTEAAAGYADAARINLATASSTLAAVSASSSIALISDNPSAALHEIKMALRTSSSLLEETRSLLRNTIEALKEKNR